MSYLNAQYPLISNGSATGAAVEWRGGRGVFAVQATFGGGTVKLQFLGPDGVNWIDAGADCTLAAAGAGGFELGPCSIRAAITGGPSAIYASVYGVG